MKSMVALLVFVALYASVNAWTAIERTNRLVRHTGHCYSELEGALHLHETRQLSEMCGTISCTNNGDMIYTGCPKRVVNCGSSLPKRVEDYVSQHLDAPVRRPYPDCCVVECAEDSDYTLTRA